MTESSKPRPVQQPSRKVAAFREMFPEARGARPPEFWGAIDYTPKVSLQSEIRKALKAAGDPTPDTVMSVADNVLASIKPADRDDALRTALLICVLELVNTGRRLGGAPKEW
jgi:hypothetical protein